MLKVKELSRMVSQKPVRGRTQLEELSEIWTDKRG